MIKLLIILLASLNLVLGAKILAFFPFPAKSHHNIFHPVIQGLGERGHQVTFVTTVSLGKPNANVKEIKMRNILDDLLKNIDLTKMNKGGVFGMAMTILGMSDFLAKGYLETKEFQDILSSDEKYDLILTESLFMQEAQSILAHRFNAIDVDLSTQGYQSWYAELSGFNFNPSYMTDGKTTSTPNMDFLGRLQNTLTTAIYTAVGYYNLYRMDKMAEKYMKYPGSENRPSLYKLASDKALILLNSHHSMGYPIPMSPNVKEVGGLNINDPKPLPKDLQTFMDDARDGVIYFSFGSNLNMTELAKQGVGASLIKLFGTLKQRVLWKWDSDEFPKASANVKFSRWFPQQDILAHKNTKLFITHGGLLSITEAINAGVPLIGVPIFADQPANMRHVVNNKYGLQVDYENMTETSMKWAIDEIMTNSIYTNEAKKRSALFNDRPMKPVQEAVYWIEYVLKHKKVLQPRSVHLSFFVMHQWDVIGACLVALYALKWLTCKLLSLIFCRKSQKNVKDIKKKKQ